MFNLIPQKKSVDSVMKIFTTAISDLQQVAEQAEIDASTLQEKAANLRAQMLLQIQSLEDKSANETAEALKAKAIMTKLTSLME